MSKSAIYVVNTSDQVLTGAGTVALTNTVRKYGPNLALANGVQISGAGYYDITANATFSATSAGAVTLSVMRDGVQIPGASATLTAEAATVYNVSIACLDREFCNCAGPAVITLYISAAGTVNNASMTVEKL